MSVLPAYLVPTPEGRKTGIFVLTSLLLKKKNGRNEVQVLRPHRGYQQLALSKPANFSVAPYLHSQCIPKQVLPDLLPASLSRGPEPSAKLVP